MNLKISGTIFIILLSGYLASGICKINQSIQKQPENDNLFHTITRLDSIFWEAYNTCDLELQAKLYADNIEFYHDQAGLITSKQMILEATKYNICGKVTRELIDGSIEVYPINGFGAVETGMHRFISKTENGTNSSAPGKFIFIWQHQNNEWKISRVVSLH